jgi:signal transduction histidine kinase
MSNNFKFSYVNINQEDLAEELNKRGTYYANVVMWTILFSLPIFWLLDYLFLERDWTDYILIRLIATLASYVVYTLSQKKRWNYRYTLVWFMGIQITVNAIICGVVPVESVRSYLMLFSIIMLLMNTTIFWPPRYPVVFCLISYIIIIWLYSYKERFDKYNILIAHGGLVYFLMSAFSCLVAYNRYNVLKRETAKNILIEEANNRLLQQNEKINDQRYVIEDANRKLKTLNDYRHNTMNIMLHDFRNFTGSIQMSLELLKNKSDNLNEEQKEILNYIGTGNEKLNYLSEKLAGSADKDEAKVEFNYEKFDIGPFVEKATMDIADAAQIKQISLQLHLSPSAIMVYLDKLFLGQVLFKLLNNAIRYAESNSIITIHTHKLGDKCVIEVVNVGKLIGKEKMNDLFNRLQPYKSLREAMQNEADMGFSIAKKLTETMGGQLLYNSSEETSNYYRIEFNSTH